MNGIQLKMNGNGSGAFVIEEAGLSLRDRAGIVADRFTKRAAVLGIVRQDGRPFLEILRRFRRRRAVRDVENRQLSRGGGH